MFYSYVGYATMPYTQTNTLLFSLPEDEGRNGEFDNRVLTFQEYTPLSTDANMPDPNSETYPVYLVRNLIADGNGVGVVVLPDIPKMRYAGTWHYFILRIDKISLADFNDDRAVDANGYAVVLRDLGKVGNSMGDVASVKDAKIVLGIPDGKVDETDVAAFEQELARYQALVAAVEGR
jgi:hypothetical protein